MASNSPASDPSTTKPIMAVAKLDSEISSSPYSAHTVSAVSAPIALTSCDGISCERHDQAMNAAAGVPNEVDSPLFPSSMALRSKDSTNAAKRPCRVISSTEEAALDFGEVPKRKKSRSKGTATLSTRTAEQFYKADCEYVGVAAQSDHNLFSSPPTSSKLAAAFSKIKDIVHGQKCPSSTWLWKRDGKLWPVVLCDDSVPPLAFLLTRHDECHVAAILLGWHKYIWVDVKGLQEYNPSEKSPAGAPILPALDIDPMDDEMMKEEHLRHCAFTVDAPMFETPRFWKNYIDNARAIKALEKAQRARELKRKRRRVEEGDERE
nr:hypothetical protein CFP56_21996 [Quercus suber]